MKKKTTEPWKIHKNDTILEKNDTLLANMILILRNGNKLEKSVPIRHCFLKTTVKRKRHKSVKDRAVKSDETLEKTQNDTIRNCNIKESTFLNPKKKKRKRKKKKN